MPEVRIPKTAVTRFDLPPVCVATGETAGVNYQKVTFSYVPMWARLSVALCGLVGLVLMVVNTKRVRVDVPFTDAAFAAYKRGKLVVGLLVLASLVPLFGSFLVGTDALFLGLFLFLAIVVAAVVYAAMVVKGLGPTCKEIDSAHVRLVIPNDVAADAIVQRLGLKDAPVSASARAADEDEYDRRLQAELDRVL